MPELPEVETIRGTLERFVLQKEIASVSVLWPGIIQHPTDTEAFKMLLHGETIQKIARRGKFLLFYLTDYVLVSHLRMEGKYRVVDSHEEVGKHTHLVILFMEVLDFSYIYVCMFGS